MFEEEESLPSPPAPEETNLVEQLTATRSPTVATKTGRSTVRLQNFLKGKSRLSYALNPDLERSLSSPDTSLISEESEQEEWEPCKRGCTAILKRLAKTFNDVGRHSATTHAVYMKSYPNPKKEATAYRNLSGELYPVS